jgi:hypothetical protein
MAYRLEIPEKMSISVGLEQLKGYEMSISAGLEQLKGYETIQRL